MISRIMLEVAYPEKMNTLVLQGGGCSNGIHILKITTLQKLLTKDLGNEMNSMITNTREILNIGKLFTQECVCSKSLSFMLENSDYWEILSNKDTFIFIRKWQFL